MAVDIRGDGGMRNPGRFELCIPFQSLQPRSIGNAAHLEWRATCLTVSVPTWTCRRSGSDLSARPYGPGMAAAPEGGIHESS
jgi:hypothetical protein